VLMVASGTLKQIGCFFVENQGSAIMSFRKSGSTTIYESTFHSIYRIFDSRYIKSIKYIDGKVRLNALTSFFSNQCMEPSEGSETG